MDVSDVIRKAGRRFGDSNNVLILETDFIDFINDGQTAIAREVGPVVTTTSVAASTYPVAFATGYIRTERIDYGGYPLQMIDKDDLDDQKVDPSTNPDRPYFYYFFNNQTHLYPDPTSSDSTTVNHSYWGMPTTVVSTATALSIPEKYQEDLVTFVTARCHERNENWSMYSRLMDEFKAGISTRLEEAKVSDDSYPVIRDDYWDNWNV